MTAIGNANDSSMSLPMLERMRGTPTQRPTEGVPGSFTELLQSGFEQVNSVQQDANAQVHELLTGGDVSQVEVLTAVQKADMAFRLLVQVRNKLMAAYEEINAIRV